MAKPFIFQVTGYKNTGKTTLMCGLVRFLKSHGFRVGTVKHDSHDFDIDLPGTDSWKHREAGADITAIASPYRTAVMESRPASLDKLIGCLGNADIVLVEGFKQEPYAKVVLVKEDGHLALLKDISGAVAVGTWFPCEVKGLPVYQASDVESIGRLLLSCMADRKEG